LRGLKAVNTEFRLLFLGGIPAKKPTIIFFLDKELLLEIENKFNLKILIIFWRTPVNIIIAVIGTS
jgi:hypothetical protein